MSQKTLISASTYGRSSPAQLQLVRDNGYEISDNLSDHCLRRESIRVQIHGMADLKAQGV
ncbi:MAG: hypothetical protein P8H62_09690 [Henriciella sp.]|nr:hypothetical protein [Henriciella sp.]